MESYLKESLGVIVYQEDVLLSAIHLAGYSWLDADKFRKAIGKKIPVEMAAQKEQLTAGIIKNGQTKDFADKLWKLFEPFQGYGFNKAHAASYGLVAYQTAYMKANFPIEYMAAVLTADSGNVDKVAETITECTRMGIAVLPPDINESFSDFTVTTNDEGVECIRFGLKSIKNFGEGIGDVLIAERKENGVYASLGDLLSRIQDRNLNRKSLEALIKSGSLDRFAERGVMLGNIETLLEYNKHTRDAQNHGHESLFATTEEATVPDVTLEDAPAARKEEMLAWEKELLGLYVSGHPLDSLRGVLEKRGVDIKKIRDEYKDGMIAVPGGLIEEIRAVTTKKGEHMAFVTLSDFSGKIEVVLFPRIFGEHRFTLKPEQCIAVKGRVSHRNGEPSIVGEAIKFLTST